MDIRNFCIIAHVDHGKSTLSDRIIEVTGTVPKRLMRDQLLDQLDLERERGITIKLQPIRMSWRRKHPSTSSGWIGSDEPIQLNLIDTPGHTDFRYEVSRSLAAVEGAVLLVDATQGIQAQTLATLHMARAQGLVIVPAVNKIDLSQADVPRVRQDLATLLSCPVEDVLLVSGKEGTGVEELLQAVVDRIAPPSSVSSVSSSRALIFDAIADPYRGVVAYVRVREGEMRAGVPLSLLHTQHPFIPTEVGSFDPKFHPEERLTEGEIGYIVTGLKDLRQVQVGDTVCAELGSTPLPGYQQVRPMVFAGLYPTETQETLALRDALEKLQLNDAALCVEPERNAALGSGFRCGFLGLLHMEVVQERLEREHGCDLVVTAPTVQYEVKIRAKRAAAVVRTSLLLAEGTVALISNPADFPDPTFIEEIREPWVALEIVAPAGKVGVVMELVQGRRGVYLGHDYLDRETAVLHFEVPLQGIVLDFFVIAAVVAVAVAGNLIAAAATGLGLSILLFIREQIRGSVVRRKLYGDQISSKRHRLPAEKDALKEHGSMITVCQLQGSLFFGTTDQLFKELEPDLKRSKYVILDMTRVQSVDFTAAHMLEQIEAVLKDHQGRLIFTNLPMSLPWRMML